MKLILKSVFLIIFCIGLFSCAITPQTVRLAPNVDITNSSEGNGAMVSVKVSDERPQSTIGHRGPGFGAKISIKQNLKEFFQNEILKGLTEKGFKPFLYKGKGKPILRVEIRSLKYHISGGFLTNDIYIGAAIKAIANVGDNSYEHFYRVENEKRAAFSLTAKDNEKLINEVIDDVLRKLLNDSELINFLANKK